MDTSTTTQPRSARNQAGQVLCRLDEIPDGTAKGFELDGSPDGGEPLEILVVREGDRAFAYVNVCPHTGSPLDWQPDDFMSEDGCNIMCHTHGALFEVADGFCVAGPCAGDSLTAVKVALDASGNVVLSEAVSDSP
ncbi:MAG: Rieske 2Fe-2S domain-containing protein [Kiloniellales bacterium]|nr:Rieske 2Fe-2S domain-containing protein [Kiloniellales bacterium]